MKVKNKVIVFSAVVSALLWGVLAANGFEQALSLTAALTLPASDPSQTCE